MSKIHDDFIYAFKRVEQNIRRMNGAPPDANFKWFEDHVNNAGLQTKMRLCRMIRNYVQHESDYEGFIGISEGMIEFLNVLNKSVCRYCSSIRDVMTPISQARYLTDSDTVSSAAGMFHNGSKYVVYFSSTSGQFGVITQDSINGIVASDYTGRTYLGSVEEFIYFGDEWVRIAYVDDAKEVYSSAIENGVKLVVKNDACEVVGLVI